MHIFINALAFLYMECGRKYGQKLYKHSVLVHD